MHDDPDMAVNRMARRVLRELSGRSRELWSNLSRAVPPHGTRLRMKAHLPEEDPTAEGFVQLPSRGTGAPRIRETRSYDLSKRLDGIRYWHR
jgi:hypothetical protein